MVKIKLEKVIHKIAAPICKRSMTKYIRPDDIFIVTYPKSGTHWLRYIFAYLINTKNNITPQVNFNNIQDIVPDINRGLYVINFMKRYNSLNFRRSFVTHANVYFAEILPNIIYIVRDPRDVMVSYYFHQMRNRRNFNLTLDGFIQQYENLLPCTWDEHVGGWLGMVNENMLKIKYEDMQNDIESVLKKINFRFNLNYSNAEMESAIENSNITKLRTIEKEFGTPHPMGDQNINFFRKGTVGGFRNELTQEQIKFINIKVKAVVDKFNLAYDI